LDNHISGSDVGVYQYASPNCCTISENLLQDNRFFGIVIQDGDGAASENTITGGQIGIGVVAAGADTVGVLNRNRIKRTTVNNQWASPVWDGERRDRCARGDL
jgi:parallel beta-helix repeat protein